MRRCESRCLRGIRIGATSPSSLMAGPTHPMTRIRRLSGSKLGFKCSIEETNFFLLQEDGIQLGTLPFVQV